MKEVLFEVRQEDGPLIGWERLNEQGQWEKSYVGRGDKWLLGIIFYETPEQKPLIRKQFVLTDAYGEKVFLGDICRDTSHPEHIFEIVWNDFSFSSSTEQYRDLFELYERNRIEKIGNTFDNPEILYNN